ncbi:MULTISPECIES: GNAT family N-acetyltransferase [Nostocales]|nr:GNAT family N-acetyltransferase [Tolypothrix bouteillei]KAF3887841.1 GNAT family N-acetyltransferase [Tolypothrix bouteillei VB521301]
MERLYTYHQAYLYEMGKLPRNFLDDWQQIFSLLSSIELPVFAELGLRIGLGVGLAIGTGVGTYFITILLLSRKSSNYAVWVVEHKQQIVGWASLLMQTNYTVLSTIYIDPKHRLQGVGSHLLWRCLKNVRKPVYLICYPHLQGFYARIGFVSLSKQDMPKELQFSKLLGMRLLHEPTLITNQSSMTPPLLPKLSIRPFQEIEEQWHIYKTFWRRKRFRKSRLDVLTLVVLVSSRPFVALSGIVWSLEAIFGFTEFAHLNFSVLGIQFSGITITLWVFLFSISLLWFFAKCQEWIVERDGSLIGYIHFSHRGNCSILYNLHIEPQYNQQNLSKLLLARLNHQISRPLYFNCPRADRQFYTGLGFSLADRRELPFEFQFFQLTGYVPLKLTNLAMTDLLEQLVQSVEPICDRESIPLRSQTHLQAQQLKRKRWIWMTVAALLLGVYTIAPLFKIPQISSELKQQIPTEELKSDRIVQRLEGKESIRALAIASDNQTVARGNEDGKIQIWDLKSKSLQQTLNVSSSKIQSLALSPDNQTLIVGTSIGTIQLWNYKLGILQEILSPTHLGEIQTLKISRNGQTLVSSSWKDASVKVWDLNRGQIQHTINTGVEVLSVAESPDGQTLYIGTLGAIKIWDLEHHALVQHLAAHSREVEVIAMSADGKLLVSGGIDRQFTENKSFRDVSTVKIWDAQSFTLLKTLQIYSSSLESISISPDGKTIVFNDCCQARWWQWMKNKYVSDIYGLNHNTVLSSDGTTLVGVGFDRKTITIAKLSNLLQSSSSR